MPLTITKFDQDLRIYETLLILEPDNILAQQHHVRRTIRNVVSKNVLNAVDLAMLVHIFKAPQSLDMALVDFAIHKAWEQLASGLMPFVTMCAAYRTIIQSQRPHPNLNDFRESILLHNDTKLTLDEFFASLNFLCQADHTLEIMLCACWSLGRSRVVRRVSNLINGLLRI